ncbi:MULTISPECIES: hypothetical protein [Streptomyces]|uniref:hypothetical protein n=1 Tax=Streptomyces TaxID=1883 RepID=UPI0012FEC10E|nr:MULTISPECIES: hypothetical protein [Streptomyces]
MQRGIDVENSAGVVVIGDGNEVVTGPPTVVRSAYWEQVRRIAPDELVGREGELAELAAFSRTGNGYLWWRADAWAGKSALMASFALAPPPGVRIVPFFITARLGAQNDAAAYVDVVLEQLAELAGEGVPALLTAATCEAHLLRLYRTAAQACAARGERLVLLVDGLDEDRGVTTGPDAHSIASLLPADLPVIVSGRPNPPLPADVPEAHPLRDPGTVRLLTPSPAARAIRVEAERELKRLLEAGGLPYALLGLLTAAGGGLTADDLVELTGEIPYRVRDVLRTGPGRTFAVRGDAYLLAHEELASGAREMLGPRELDQYRGRLHTWAEAWRSRGWPEATPEYLLRGYFPMLGSVGDVKRMVLCALDTERQDRMLDVMFGDFVALAEIRVAEEALITAGVPDLLDSVRLAIRREALEDRNYRVDATLPWAWAALGHFNRAEALARSIPAADDRAYALVRVAEELVEHRDQDGAVRLIEAVEQAASEADQYSTKAPAALERACRVLLRIGSPEQAEALLHQITDTCDRERLLPHLAQWWVRAGESARAEAMVLTESDPRVRAMGVAAVAGAWAETGAVPQARSFLSRASSADPGAETLAGLRIAAALLASGRQAEADSLIARAETTARGTPVVTEAIGLLATLGERDRALGLVAGIADGPLRSRGMTEVVHALAAAGACEEAEALAFAIEQREARGEALLAVVSELAGAGRCDEARRLGRRITEPHLRQVALGSVVKQLAITGEFGPAEALARECTHDDHQPMRWVVEALAAAGEFARAETLARSIDYDEGLFALARGVALSTDSRDLAASRIAAVEREVRVARPPGLMDLVAYANVLVETGHGSAALPLLADAEAELPEPAGPHATEFERLRRNLMVEAIAATYARIGKPDEAESLMHAIGRAFHEGWLAVIEAHARAGNEERLGAALAALDDSPNADAMRAMACPVLAAEGLVETAVAVAGRVEGPDARVRAWASTAAALAAAGEDQLARVALAEAEAVPSSSYMWLMAGSDLVTAYAHLGDEEEVDLISAEVEAHAGSQADFTALLVQALVRLGRYEEAEALVRRIGERLDADTRSNPPKSVVTALVAALIEAGQNDRSHRVAITYLAVPEQGDTEAWALLAPVLGPRRGRVLAARTLQAGDFPEALQAALRLEPRAVPLVVDALRRPRQV